MRTTRLEQRPSGLPSPATLPWGSHFGVFYASDQELLEVLAPFVRAGLEADELCVWETVPSFAPGEARAALAQSIPDLDEYLARGQLEIVPAPAAAAPDVEASRLRRLDRAMLAGFAGLRVVTHAPDSPLGNPLGALAETLAMIEVIAAVAYPRGGLSAVRMMQVVQDHCFALVRGAARWEVLEGSEAKVARDAISRSDQELESLFRNMLEGFAYHRIVLDRLGEPRDYVFLEINEAFERVTGLRASEVIGRRVTQVLPGIEHDPTDWIHRYGRVALTGEPARFESYAEPLQRWYAVSAFCPHPGYFATAISDITDRKRAEAQQRAAEERLSVTLRSIGDAVIATDTEGRITLMNGVAERLTAWSEAEAVGRALGDVFRILDEDSGEPAEDPVRRVIEQGSVVGLANHTILLARDGCRIAIADSAAPMRSGTSLLGAVLVFRDVTAERRAEKALLESRARFKLLSDTAGQLLASTDPQSLVSDLCHAVMLQLDCQLFLYHRLDTATGTLRLNASWGISKQEKAGIEPLDCAGCTCECFARAGNPVGPEGLRGPSDPHADRARSYGMLAHCCHPLVVQERVVGTLCFGTNTRQRFTEEEVELLRTIADQISTAMERIEARRALSAANAQLLDADRHKNEFLAILSHELRNPLTPIRNSLSILDRATPGGQQSQRAQRVIDRQVTQLTNLVNDLLDVTRITRNKVQLQKERLELNEIARRAIEDNRSLFERAQVRLELNAADHPILVQADSTRLAQIIGNLLGNAAKFTLPGGRTRLDVTNEDGQATVRVTDDGVGMSAETLRSLFRPFSQADQTIDRSKGGLGLGLALIKGLAELHGGSVSAHSDGPGRGSEFTVRLPVEPELGAEAVTAQGTAGRCRRRVLVIEDNHDAADSLRELLEFKEHEVAVAYSGAQGLELAPTFKPDLVLCDIGLPGVDGYQVARTLRRDPQLREVVLIALSGYARPEDVAKATESGFDQHVAKPLSFERLEELLTTVPSMRQQAGAAPRQELSGRAAP